MLDRTRRPARNRRRDRSRRCVRDGASPLSRTLGVVGTLVWDRFETDGPAIETWGGIAYGLAAAAAALGPTWRVRPLVKVGRDLEAEARAFLSTIPSVDDGALLPVEQPNNRVTLRYLDEAERVERLSGGVPAWTSDELAGRVAPCDALLVNFISGYEASLETCRSTCASFDGPIHADLHSLFLGTEADGTRVPQRLVDFEAWVACFDSVQLNEAEARLAGAGTGALEAFARQVTSGGPSVCAVTRGAAGTTWAAHSPKARARWSSALGDGARVGSGSVTIRSPREGDPTGCGDVWGAAFFARTLAGDPVPVAAEIATRLAARNVEHRGAEGLYNVLAREVSP